MASTIKVWTVDSFATSAFAGNPAGVCLVDSATVTDATMQKIAAEMNISETAFISLDAAAPSSSTFEAGDAFGLRWFTPTREVPLCGHATMAAAKVLFDAVGNGSAELKFATKSGELRVTRDGPMLQMSLPWNGSSPTPLEKYGETVALATCGLPAQAAEYSAATKKLIVRLQDSVTQAQLEAIAPDTAALQQSHTADEIRGVSVCLAGGAAGPYDFVSRYFAPWNGIPEDPVNGSSHTVLGPYWGAALSKTELRARQCSARGGDLWLTLDETQGRVICAGKATIVLEGRLFL